MDNKCKKFVYTKFILRVRSVETKTLVASKIERLDAASVKSKIEKLEIRKEVVRR